MPISMVKGTVVPAPRSQTRSSDEEHFRLPAVDRAMSLLELLATTRGGFTLSELSRKLQIPKSTTHYLIHTLASRGYVQRTSNRRHVLGLRFADLADASTAELNLSVIASPTLRRVAAKSNLTATLSILRGSEAVIISRARSFDDAAGGAWVGHHLDLHCTAQGKALIAGLSEERLNQQLMRCEFSQYTSKTILSLMVLKKHLAEIRTNGFAVNDEEEVVGVRAVAAPVVDPGGNVIACISVRGSTEQISTFRFPQLGREMIRAARELSLQATG